MKAYIQSDLNGDYYNVNAFVAAVGYKALGYEVIKYQDSSNIPNLEKESIFVGGVGMVRKRLEFLGIKKQNEIEYPTELRSFLNRKVWTSSLKKLITNQQTNFFIKPVETKLFQGKIITDFKDFIGLNYEKDVAVWCSEIVNLVTEWRCFIRYKEILDVRYYKGQWDSRLDIDIVKKAIASYSSQPAAYCFDFGVDANGKHFLVEVNDGHSLGTYGLGAISYAKFLSARWAEMTNTRDYLNF